MDNMIVDEQTVVDGRRYSDGLHQAIEENVKSKPQHKPLQPLRYRIISSVQQTGRNDWNCSNEAGELWQI
jgi:hypothetical protein